MIRINIGFIKNHLARIRAYIQYKQRFMRCILKSIDLPLKLMI
jgi:hypothetical protein